MLLKYLNETPVDMEITPDIAALFLEHNYYDQRRKRPSDIARYANDMKNGRWHEYISHYQDPIMFNREGFMINGQNRCYACIEAQTPFRTRVLFGVNDPNGDVYRHLDGGAARIAADFIVTANPKSVAARAKVYIALKEGDTLLASAIQGKTSSDKRVCISRDQIIKVADQNAVYFERIVNMGNKLASPFGRQRGAFADAVLVIDFVGRGDVLEAFVDDFASANSQNPTIAACKSYMTKCYLGNHETPEKWVIGVILMTYENYKNKKVVGTFGRWSDYFDRYDKYLSKAREEL